MQTVIPGKMNTFEKIDMGSESKIEKTILNVLSSLDILDTGRIDTESDLFDAGMTSHASVRLMLALEDAFDIEFPDEMLQREYFSSVESIRRCVSQITSG